MTNAFEIPHQQYTLVVDSASADIKRYRFVTVNTTSLAVAASTGGSSIGVSRNEAKKNEMLEVVGSGISFVEAGTGGLTAGKEVAVGASGVGVDATGTAKVVGITIVGAAAGAIGTVKLFT